VKDLAVGAVFRRESRWLREWLEFYLMLGVEKFFLYNHDLPEDRSRSDAVLKPYVDAGLVENIHFDVIKDFQMTANDGMVAKAKAEGFTWLAVVDIDEFLFPLAGTDLCEALRPFRLPDVAGLAVYWRCFGTSGLMYSPMLQTEGFVQRAPDTHRCNMSAKYVFRLAHVTSYGEVKKETRFVDENMQTFDKTKRHGSAKRLRINHYGTRSESDWALRVQRGLPPGGFRIDPKDMPNFYTDRWALFNQNEVHDTVIHRFLPDLKRRLHIES
jgi:hypothetical protein